MQAPSQKNLLTETRVYIAGVMAGRPPSKTAPVFGQRLASARRARGLTQPQLAKMLDMTVKGIDYYERRAHNPSIEFVQRAAKALRISVADLIGNSEGAKRERPGPTPKLQRQFKEIQELPRSKQRFISQVIESVLRGEAHTE